MLIPVGVHSNDVYFFKKYIQQIIENVVSVTKNISHTCCINTTFGVEWRTYMQKMVSVKNVSFTTSDKPILSNVSFTCTMNERLCLFGENGAGKSTLLKILAGEQKPSAGDVHTQGYLRVHYVSQEFSRVHKDFTVKEYIELVADTQRYKKVYAFGDKLGFRLEDHTETLCGSLSGGQQRILALAVAFAVNPDYLLLDEPENHIDIVSRAILIEMLQEYRGGIIFVSHDRYIIDSVATKVGEIAEGEIFISEGGYDAYIETKQRRIGGLQRAYQSEEKRIKQLKKTLSIMQKKAVRGNGIAQYKLRKKEYEGLVAKHKDRAKPTDTETRIRLDVGKDALHTGKRLIHIGGGTFGFPGNKLFKKVSLDIRTGEKIALLGRNGTGKSTFINCLLGTYELQDGEVTIAPDIQIAYFDQHAAFNPDHTAEEVIQEELNLLNEDAKSVLGAAKFDVNRMGMPVRYLSGGERMRLRLSITFGKKPDLLILDEPTNHIDEVTWDILLKSCQDFAGTILLVSHDHEFIDSLEPTVYFMMQKKTITKRHKDLETLLEEMCTVG